MQKIVQELNFVMCKFVTHAGVKTTKATLATGGKHEVNTCKMQMTLKETHVGLNLT